MKQIVYLLLVFLHCSPLFADELVFAVKGVAADPSSGEALYTERHFVQEDPQGSVVKREVLYEAPDGTLIAKKTNMASSAVWVPTFELEDLRSGYQESLRVTDGTFLLRVREGGRDQWKEKQVKRTSGNWVADAGFDPFIRHHLAQLLRGESVDFWFLSPARQAAIAFRVESSGRDGDQLRLRMVLQNSLLRLLVDPIELVYQIGTGRLVTFSGITNLLRENGKHYEAVISYVYP